MVRGTLGSAAGLAAGIAALAAVGDAAARPRVYSLDQCADQYVLALAPRADIAALSPRADDADSYLRAQAVGLPLRRAALEPILASRARLVVRYWGGDQMLLRSLERRGVHAVTIDDATDFPGVRSNIRKVAAALSQTARGEQLVARMDRDLAKAARAQPGRSAMYMTSGGFTAGDDTLIGAMLAAAGLRNLAPRSSFAAIPLEKLVMTPPSALVLGYFDTAALATQRWAFGRHHVVQTVARQRTVAALPSTVLGCPAWFSAEGAALLAGSGGARP